MRDLTLWSWPDAPRSGEDHAGAPDDNRADWLYVRIACQTGEMDAILLDLVAPLAQQLWKAGLIRQCFFIRYAEGGHHVRVRFFGKQRELLGPGRSLVDASIQAYFAEGQQHVLAPLDPGPEGMNDQSWQPRYAAQAPRPIPSYEYQRYEPEIERYGGPHGLRVSEQHFASSSAVALRVLAWEREGYGSRRNAAILLLHASAESFQLDAQQKALCFEQFYLRRLALAWRTPPEQNHLAQEYARQRTGLHLLVSDGACAPARRCQAVWGPLVEHWRRKLGDTYRLLQRLQEQDRLATPPIALLSAYIHMLCNRLGIYQREETYLCYFLYRLYTEHLALSRVSG